MATGLLDKINAEITTALKSGDTKTRELLGMVKAAITNARIAKKKDSLTDEEIIAVIAKEAKSRRDAAAEYRKGGAEDRALSEESEAVTLEKYLPAQMSDEDIAKAVDAALSKTGATSAQQMGKVMGVLSKELRGKADLKKVNELVRKKLAA